MRCFSADLSGRFPSVSLLSYWLLLDLKEKFWVTQRGGMLCDPLFACIPPPDAITDEIVFIGNPLEGIEFANRLEIDGMSCSLWVVGINDNTPPISPTMASKLKSIAAPKETAQWLRRCGIDNVIELDVPESIKQVIAGSHGAPDNEEMYIDVANGAHVKAPLPFEVDVRRFRWAVNGEVMLPSDVAARAEQADVCLVDGFIMDDPIRAVFEGCGVPCVAARPDKGQWGRLIEAAQMRHADVLRPFGTDEQQVVAEPDGDMSDIDGDIYLDSGEPTPRLGIVIPFGGLPVEGLRKTLKRLQRMAPADVPIVVSHQTIKGSLQDDEARELDGLLCECDVPMVDVPGLHDKWSLSVTRNHGAAFFTSDITHVMFLDADIMVDRGFFELLIGELGLCPLVPWVRNEDGTTRIASGLATYPRKLLERTGGFDESFVGWGYEDLELLSRCRDMGCPSLLIGSPVMPLLRHIDHAPRWEETRAANYARYQERDEYCYEEKEPTQLISCTRSTKEVSTT